MAMVAKSKPAMSPTIMRAPNGLPLMVIRPDDPEKAIRIASECQRANDHKRLENLPQEVGNYRFIGYASKGRPTDIVDDRGNVIDRLAPGDSFITEQESPPRKKNEPS